MKITLDLDINKLETNSLTPKLYIYLYCLVGNISYPFTDITESDKLYLQQEGWIKLIPDGVSIRSKTTTFLGVVGNRLEVEAWIEEWRNLWPKIQSMGRPVRGSRKDCIKKMTTFLKENSEVTKEDVFLATRIYLFEKEKQNWAYLTCADYFINKDNKVSLLAALVEDIEGKETFLEKIENGGTGPFHKEI